jgi:hypothetical protein
MNFVGYVKESGLNMVKKQVVITIATNMRTLNLRVIKKSQRMKLADKLQKMNLIDTCFTLRGLTIMIRLRNTLDH